MIAYDIFIDCVGLLAWFVLVDMLRQRRENDASFHWRFFIVMDIAAFITIRTLAVTIDLIHAPTFFFSAWGAIVFAHVLGVIWFSNRKGI